MTIGFILIGLSIATYYWLGKRSFQKTNVDESDELAHFKNLWKARVITLCIRLFIVLLFTTGMLTIGSNLASH